MPQKCVMILLINCALLDSEIQSLESIIHNIIKEAPIPLKVTLLMQSRNWLSLNNKPFMREVGIESLRKPSQDTDTIYKIKRRENDKTDKLTPYDEHDIVMTTIGMLYKLSRNCYKKANRAEIIREKYANNSAFEMGILVGEVEGLFSWLNKFRATMRFFTSIWMPIELLNAYEHVETYALQIKQMIDIIEIADKKKSG